MFLAVKNCCTKHCAPVHYHGEATSPVSTIVLDVFSGFAHSDSSKLPGSNAGSLVNSALT
jgi:hypothetical protein